MRGWGSWREEGLLLLMIPVRGIDDYSEAAELDVPEAFKGKQLLPPVSPFMLVVSFYGKGCPMSTKLWASQAKPLSLFIPVLSPKYE